jgi:glycolate oxidase FAD binding subunit
VLCPATGEEAAAVLAEADRSGRMVRLVGGGTKLGWGRPSGADIVLSTATMDRVLEHNAPDLTAVLEAGTPLSAAQAAFATSGQMIAVDPPDPGGATIGGIVSSGDSGPLRHRYGAPRDLLLGIRVALADGTLARAGGRVIKNVAGYDLAKLFAGAFGTLGLILEVAVRLHPLPVRSLTVAGGSDDPDALQRAAVAVAAAPLELRSLDVRWEGGEGAVLARIAGVAPEERVEAASEGLRREGLETELVEPDEEVWSGQRSLQRSDGAVVRVSSLSTDIARVIRTAIRVGAAMVGRAGLGPSWLNLPPSSDGDLLSGIGLVRTSLAPRPCVVLDAPETVRAAEDPWGDTDGIGLMRRLKGQFDPNGTCNPGIFVGGI